jgi:flagellar biosynthesis protein FlhA
MAKNKFEEQLEKMSWLQKPDILIAIGVVTVILMLIIPLPSFLIDIFIAINLSLAIIILLTTIYASDPVEFTVFPTLLLITTLFGLALNISTTRLILLKGAAFDVQIVRAFGDFVVGGNYIIGFIIFVIIILVQFLVITKGATRTAEVAARFKLDEYPSKQMSIDSDYNAGLITQEEKREKQDNLKRINEFYGNMDGATKFIQGNVAVGLIITVINLLGGILIGNLMRGEKIMEALKTYALFMVGDGLSSQLPALLISTASGILVTRSQTKESFSGDIIGQLFQQPRALFIAAGILGFLFFLPGFPKIPLLFLSAIMALLGYVQYKSIQDKKESKQRLAAQKEVQEKSKAMKTDELLHIDPLEVEIGYSLIPLADQENGGDLLDRIAMIRRSSAIEMGLIIPPIRIRDNVKLEPSMYSILIKGVEMGRGRIKMGNYLAIKSPSVTEEIRGEPTTDPTYGLPAWWITESQKQKAEMAGYTVVDSPTIIATHLTDIIKNFGFELLGRKEVKDLLDNVKKTHQVLVDEIEKEPGMIGTLQKVLQSLLMERVSIRDMITILETVIDYKTVRNVDFLVEMVRQSLKRQISNAHKDASNVIHVVRIDPEIEQLLETSIQELDTQFQLTLDPKVQMAIMNRILRVIQSVKAKGYSAVILTSAKVRSVIRHLISRNDPSAVVLSYQEIVPSVRIEQLDVVSFNNAAQQTAAQNA